MLNIFKKPVMIYSVAIGLVVDTFSFIQIISQKQFTMQSLITSPWFWLIVSVGAVVAGLYFYFRWQNYKASVKTRIAALENELKEYRKGVHKEFCQAYDQINGNTKSINELSWKLQRLEELQKSHPNNNLFKVGS